MKYYKIEIKSRYPDFDRISSSAEGKDIEDSEYYFRKMDEGEVINDAPIFDYFYLESFDKKQYWEWQLNDAFDFIGQGSQIPGWLISNKLKKIFETFNIAKPHFYYPSKLLYKEKKLDYYIFQFSGKQFRQPLTNHINFSKSLFYNPNNNLDFSVENEKELLTMQEKILEDSGFNIINVPIKILLLNKDIDFISMQNFLGDNIVSERLKQAIEENGIIGFEFSELNYEVVVEAHHR
ncbi:hypothetical protein [Flavobacterium covae]|uniref:hypothetical protein n=1 Tax=Flavobacterium covae TaxID=2906076 RepID=UPI003391AE16